MKRGETFSGLIFHDRVLITKLSTLFQHLCAAVLPSGQQSLLGLTFFLSLITACMFHYGLLYIKRLI